MGSTSRPAHGARAAQAPRRPAGGAVSEARQRAYGWCAALSSGCGATLFPTSVLTLLNFHAAHYLDTCSLHCSLHMAGNPTCSLCCSFSCAPEQHTSNRCYLTLSSVGRPLLHRVPTLCYCSPVRFPRYCWGAWRLGEHGRPAPSRGQASAWARCDHAPPNVQCLPTAVRIAPPAPLPSMPPLYLWQLH